MGPSGATTPSASPTAGALLEIPALRTISLAKSAWEQEIAFLQVHQAAPSRASSVTATASAPAHRTSAANDGPVDAASAADNCPAGPAYRSIFNLPILSCCTPSYRAWSLVVLALDLTYSAFILPISVGFQVNDLDFTWACILDLVVGAFFAMELGLGFHVTFVATSAGRRCEVLEGRSVAAYYVRHGSFAQDLLSTLTWLTQIVLLAVHQSGRSMPSAVSAFQLVRIVRMVRLLPILRTMFAMTISSGKSSILPGLRWSSAAVHVTNVLYSGLVLVNFFGCLWNFIAIKEGFENTWMNPVQQLVRQYSADGASLLTPEELAAVPGPRRWLLGFYFTLVTVATLGYGDIVPSTAAETAVNCFVTAFGVLMFGLVMGSIASQVANSSKEARQAQIYREKMAAVRAWTRASCFPKALKTKINSYYAQVWVKHASVADTSHLFFELPHKLRQEIAWEMNRAVFEQLPFFAGVEEPLRVILCSLMAPLETSPGQELCLQGEVADRFWILHEGEVQVVNDFGTVRTITAPAMVGETALLQLGAPKYCVRPHGYRSDTGCTLWELHLRDLMPFLAAHPEVLEAMTGQARCRLTRESIMNADAMSEGALGGAKGGSSKREASGGGLGGWGCGHASMRTPPATCLSAELQGAEEGLGCGDPEEEHTVTEFAAAGSSFHLGAEHAAVEADVGGETGQQDFSTPGTIHLVADGTSRAVGAVFSGWEAEQQVQAGHSQGSPVTRGELHQAIDALGADLAARLEELSQDVRRAVRASNRQAALPVWLAAPSPHDRRHMGRSLSERRRCMQRPTPQSPSASPASASGGMRWSYSQFS